MFTKPQIALLIAVPVFLLIFMYHASSTSSTSSSTVNDFEQQQQPQIEEDDNKETENNFKEKINLKKKPSHDESEPQEKHQKKQEPCPKAPPCLSSSSSSSDFSGKNSKKGSKFSYRPQKRYAPSLFQKGVSQFPRGQTPMTIIKNKTLLEEKMQTEQSAQVPADWDGGYSWVFVKYHPSPFEKRWREEAVKIEKNPGTPLCDMRSRLFSKENSIYEKELHRMPANHPDPSKTCRDSFSSSSSSSEITSSTSGFSSGFPSPLKEPMKFDDKVFSRFEYEYKCTFEPCHTPPAPGGPKVGDKKFSYIEPLTGLCRHPKACSADYNWIVNKNYMIVDPWVLENVGRTTISPTPPRVLFFDGGASLWDSGGGGASQTWFHSIYSSICFPFTDWFMWEARGWGPREVFSKLPGSIKSGYRWFNIPLTTSAGSWDNPWNQLLLEAKKEDIVIVKIDFDAPEVEMKLIQHILDEPRIAELIDEFYFEHHVNQEVMRRWHHTENTRVYHHDMLDLFQKLRERGVRSSQWV